MKIHQIELTLGDYSRDGHEKTETIVINSNLDEKQLVKAFEAGCKLTGVDFQNQVASDYEENTISQELVDKLSKHGFDIAEFSEDEKPGKDGYSLYTEGYAAIWLFIAKLGDPNFAHEETVIPSIHIGGYGLYE